LSLSERLSKIIAFLLRHWKVVAVIAMVMMAGASYAGWRVYNYIEHDPTFCTSCHLMKDPFERWSESGHKDVNCHTCHPGNMINNLRQLYLTATNSRDRVEEKAEVPREICSGCHLSNDPEWKQVEATVGHKIHAVDNKIDCITCHGAGVHEFVPTDEMCRKCHGDLKIAFEKMNTNHCTTCHKFLAKGRESLVPQIEDCAECHTRQVGAPPAIDAGWHPDQPCSMCHPVHDKPLAEAEPVERTGLAVTCEKCHEQVVPTSHDSCRDCHPPHAQFNPKQQCAGCHQDRQKAVEAPSQHECGDCHRPHTPGLTSLDTCIDCHNDKVKDIEQAGPMGHDACERCHVPHERENNKPLLCSDCHPGQAIAMRADASHKACTDCHNPHRAKDVPNCAKCHEKQLPALAAGKHTECGGCHKPHKTAPAANDTCTSCHKGPKEKPVYKGHDKCSGCHQPHPGKPDASPMDTCGDCHKEVIAAVAHEPEKHRVCNDCHVPHQPYAKRTKQCAECHVDQKKSLADQPKGHQNCQDCHPRHAVRGSMSCDTCHEKAVAAVAPSKAKEHKDCQGCHGGVHKPDAPAPATNALCMTCHKEIPKKGLHANKKHNDCLSCHGNHGPKIPGPEGCTNCHPIAGMPKHPPMPPGETQCRGCHNFLGDQP
jgi:nitrate/TMAO reductase-like tetraheme cytochrome c subunit